MEIACTKCGLPYPATGAPHLCPRCGGLFDYSRLWTFDPASVDAKRAGIFRFKTTFYGSPISDALSLGEGSTPLVQAKVFGRDVWFKCESANPTGSFKDRGTAALIAFLVSRGVTEAVEDSSGNAGASFAAYSARAGIRAKVFVPESASGPKRAQIEAYGAELITVQGSRANASLAAFQAANAGTVYASHSHMPFNLAGYATMAYEIIEQLGRAPAALIIPAGQGGLLLGACRGFLALQQAEVTRDAPRLVGVQPKACSPLITDELADRGTESQTIAEGVRVINPLRRDVVRRAVEVSGGHWVAVDEKDILRGRDALARQGLYIEPTSALVWSALEKVLPVLPDPVVAVLTGSGLKFRDISMEE